MPADEQPLVSVVTPVYNTEKYLSECIESILAQTYENWEYVIVNNCSTDRSLEIAHHYAQNDHRIRIHNNDHFLNQIQNWNHALRQISAKSKYCKVVHADDWLFPECLTRMIAMAEAYPMIGLVSAYRLDENRVNLDGLPYSSAFMSGREICRASFLNHLSVFGSPTSLLIRSDLIRSRKNFYNEENVHADKEVCFDILQNSDFGFVHQVLTYTRRHNEAATAFTRSINTFRGGNLRILKKYGPIYLTPEEYEVCFKQHLDNYYNFLGQKVFELRKKEFWKYHQNEFEKLGQPFSLAKLARAFLLELLNVRTTIERVRQMRRKNHKTGGLKLADVAITSETW
jgi:glycosyltransferase involved in cell wall biosynthesis